MVQQKFAENHPRRLPGKASLQRAQPEIIEVSLESDGHDGDIPRVFPVYVLPLSDELVREVPAGEQAAVQSDVGQPGEPLGGFF